MSARLHSVWKLKGKTLTFPVSRSQLHSFLGSQPLLLLSEPEPGISAYYTAKTWLLSQDLHSCPHPSSLTHFMTVTSQPSASAFRLPTLLSKCMVSSRYGRQSDALEIYVISCQYSALNVQWPPSPHVLAPIPSVSYLLALLTPLLTWPPTTLAATWVLEHAGCAQAPQHRHFPIPLSPSGFWSTVKCLTEAYLTAHIKIATPPQCSHLTTLLP